MIKAFKLVHPTSHMIMLTGAGIQAQIRWGSEQPDLV